MILGLMGALLAFMSYRRRNNLSLLPSVSLQMPEFLRPKKFAHPADASNDAISTASTLNLSSAHNSELSPSETNNSNIVNNIELILI